MQHTIRLFTCLACLFCAASGAADNIDSDPYRADRALFLEASKALDEKRLSDFRRLQSQLTDYPLYPYLQFQDLRTRLKTADHDEIARFIDQHED